MNMQVSSVSDKPPARLPAGGERRARPRRGPLAGVRVVDFCWAGVGAVATRILADFGAEVIRIEDRERLCVIRQLPIYKGGKSYTFGDPDNNTDVNKGGAFNNYNRNKFGVTINMRTAVGRSLAERLIATSSVVTENFSPGVMERWGFDYEKLCSLSPNIIYGRMSGFGHSGPCAEYKSFGPVVQAASGLTHISGLPGQEPSGWGLSYMDNEAGFFNAAALMTAIYHRNRTGVGAELDVAAVEAGINLLGPLLLDVAVNARSTRGADFPFGNRASEGNAAPHGVYPSSGEDRWIAIAVFSDAEWRALASVIGDDWALDPRLDAWEGRFANQDELDRRLATWTAGQDCHALMHRLQSAGVCAGAVQNAQDVIDRDPQIASRELFFDLDHPVIGVAKFEGVPIKFSRTRADNWRSAPLLGEDNAYVFGELLGLSPTELADLAEQGAF